MISNFKKEDLRVRKTNEALSNSMFNLLKQRRFGKITVNEICEEAVVSRAAFYSHFVDKYGLLQYCLSLLLKNEFGECNMENGGQIINDYVAAQRRMLKNLIDDADETTLSLLYNFVDSLVAQVLGTRCAVDKSIVAFFTGGLVALLKDYLSAENAEDAKLVDKKLFKIILYIESIK